MSDKKRVLFLCVGNSCRSQMAEGLLRQLAPQSFEVHSAGSEAHGLNPRAVEVMKEIGVDISRQRSKRVDEYAGSTFDFVITVCGGAGQSACPVFLGKAGTRLHWPFDDPAGAAGSEEEKLRVFRRVRDEIKTRLDRFIDDQAE
jgi:arsenate reductase